MYIPIAEAIPDQLVNDVQHSNTFGKCLISSEASYMNTPTTVLKLPWYRIATVRRVSP